MSDGGLLPEHVVASRRGDVVAPVTSRSAPPLTLADLSGSDQATASVRVSLFLVAAIFVVARFWAVPAFRPTFDEVYTLNVAQRSFPGVLFYLAKYDEHPPLFYLLVKGWTMLGGLDYWWLGLLPALIAAASLAPLLLLCRALAMSRRDTGWVVALMAVNGFLVGFAQELRPYSLLLFLTCASFWLFVTTWNTQDHSRRWLTGLAITNLLLVTVHHYGWLVIGAEWMILAYWRHPLVKAFGLSVAITVLVLTPWTLVLMDAAWLRLASGQRAFFYIPTPTLFSPVYFYGVLGGSTDAPHTLAVSLLLSAIPIGVCAWVLRQGRETRGTRAALGALLTFATFPVIVAFVVSKLSVGTAVWGQRHLIVVAAPYFLLIATGLGRISNPALRGVVAACVLTWGAVAGWQSQVEPYKIVAWDDLAEQMVRAEPDRIGPVIVYASDENAALPLQFYLQRLGARQFQVVVVQDDTLRNQRIFNGAGPRPYWAMNLPVVLELGRKWPPCGHCWIALSGSDEAGRLTESGLAVGAGFSETLINRRWNRTTASVQPAWLKKR